MPRCLWKLRQALLAESSDITGAEEPTTSSEGEATTTLTESKTCVEAELKFTKPLLRPKFPKLAPPRPTLAGHWYKANAAKAAKVGAAKAAKVGHWCRAFWTPGAPTGPRSPSRSLGVVMALYPNMSRSIGVVISPGAAGRGAAGSEDHEGVSA